MIEVFEQEIFDGLAELITDNSIAYTLDIATGPSVDYSKISDMIAKASLDEQTDTTLFPIESILATIGINLNDDVFLAEEVLKARHTPVDKPFNKMHNQDDIIGHMTASRLLDGNYNEVEGGEFEHIAVSSVIYKVWRDPDRQAEINQIIEDIQAGVWKVSMECIFPRFDYAIITPEGKQVIIERNESTAYLSKYLRKYKGPGYYNNNKIGRVLRDINFCGKGLVDNPGNPYSVIFKNNEKFSGALASLDEIKEMVMSEQEKAELERAKAEAETAKADLAKFKEEAAEAAANKLNEAVAQRDAIIAEQKTTIAGLQTDLATVNTSLAGLTEELETVKAEKTTVAEKLGVAEAALETVRVEKAIAVRTQALTDAGVSKEKAEALLEKFASASDELFATLVSTVAEFKPFTKKDDEKDKDKEKDKDDKAKADTDTTSSTADFSQANLDVSADLNVATAEKVSEDKKAIASYLMNNVLTAGKTVKTKGDK